MYLPDVPAHVALRGNKCGLFFHEDDYCFYFSVSAEVLKRYRVTKEVAIQRGSMGSVSLIHDPIDRAPGRRAAQRKRAEPRSESWGQQ